MLTGLHPDAKRLAETAEAILPTSRRRAAQREIMSWEGYAPTPLRALPGLAGRLQVAHLWCKDEGSRFGLGSFKALGGAYAVREQIGSKRGSLVVACATEGNHGRSVAWAARRFGAQCIIYLHARVSEAREQAIANYGASIRRIVGTYDDAVRQCAVDAEREGWTVISDTSWAGYEEIPRSVMAGYTVLTREIVEQMAGEAPPTHVFLQGGVGGMAAAALADLSEPYPLAATRYILVEPLDAACLMASLRANRPIRIEGEMKTVMAGLACGEPSPIALEIVGAGVSAAIAIGDDLVVEAMHMMAAGGQGDSRIVAGPSGAAGLAGLLALRSNEEACRALELGRQSRVLIINTEGDTDAAAYRRLMGAGRP
ncbi:PLP-dependent lyase/thiolase [Reyranella soli]|uniref:PLP-dependent lyase/thiolase n=2 Tax=Reyranella soli TaxID=1230389 RepID=A0A512N6M6_9HYPH|nr:PLP-dependent lyase/thiolase [Reyranella soli]